MKRKFADLAPALLDFAFNVNKIAWTEMRKYFGSKLWLSRYA